MGEEVSEDEGVGSEEGGLLGGGGINYGVVAADRGNKPDGYFRCEGAADTVEEGGLGGLLVLGAGVFLARVVLIKLV